MLTENLVTYFHTDVRDILLENTTCVNHLICGRLSPTQLKCRDFNPLAEILQIYSIYCKSIIFLPLTPFSYCIFELLTFLTMVPLTSLQSITV